MRQRFGVVGLVMGLALAGSAKAAAQPDLLTQMFTWWDAAYTVPGAYTPEAFRKYFTEDAVLMINGKVSARGVDGWATHFQKIQAAGGTVEIILPFKEEFQAGNKIYTYHLIKAVRKGVMSCTLVAGHAIVRDGKLALVSLVRAPVDPALGPIDDRCRQGE